MPATRLPVSLFLVTPWTGERCFAPQLPATIPDEICFFTILSVEELEVSDLFDVCYIFLLACVASVRYPSTDTACVSEPRSAGVFTLSVCCVYSQN